MDKFALDKLDRTILFELDSNSRQPLATLAKKVHQSRNVVEYRMRRLQERGIITNFVTLMDAGALSLTVWNVYVEFENVTSRIEKEIISYLRDQPRIWWISLVTGRWNLVYSVCGRDLKEIYSIVSAFKSRFGGFIQNQSLTAHVEAEIFSRGYFLSKPSQGIRWYKKSAYSLDEKDRTILKNLATDARISASRLALQTGLTSRVVSWRIKKLLAAGIITRFRLQLDVSKIGYGFYKVIIHIRNPSQENHAALREYCRKTGRVFHYIQKLGPWMLELEMDCESFEEAHRMMKTMRERFSDFLKSYEIMLVYEEPKGELDLSRQL